MVFKPKSSAIDRAVLFFLFVCILSVVGSPFVKSSFYGFITKTVEWFVIYYLVLEVFTEKRHIFIALGITVFTGIATVLDSLWQFYFSQRDIFLGYQIVKGERATASFKTANTFAGYLTLLIPLVFVLMPQSRRLKMVLLSAVILSFWSLAVSFTIGAVGSILMGGIFFSLWILQIKKNQYFFAVSSFCLLIFVIVFWVWTESNMGIKALFNHRLTSWQWRLTIWNDALVMIRESPLFGHGVNTFMRIFQVYDNSARYSPTYAHNCFIQLAAETGLVGLGAFLWIVWGIAKTALRSARLFYSYGQDKMGIICLGILSGVIAFLGHSFIDTNLYSLQLSAFFWYVIGLLFSVENLFSHSTTFLQPIKK